MRGNGLLWFVAISLTAIGAVSAGPAGNKTDDAVPCVGDWSGSHRRLRALVLRFTDNTMVPFLTG